METKSKQNNKREEYKVTIGPLLKQILKEQKINIKEAGYGCLKPSDYDAGEIIAKKIIQNFGGIKNCGKNIL